MAVKLDLPWPPSVNKLWRTVRNRWYMTRDGINYKETVKLLYIASKAPNFALNERLSLTILAYPPDARRRDLDNLLKITGDSLQDAGVFENDCQIKQIYMEMREKCDGGRIEVLIEVL